MGRAAASLVQGRQSLEQPIPLRTWRLEKGGERRGKPLGDLMASGPNQSLECSPCRDNGAAGRVRPDGTIESLKGPPERFVIHQCGADTEDVTYARVSTADQDLSIQRVRLHEAGCVKLFEEITSGARKKRPELERLLVELRADDVVVVTRLDRLARSTSELLRIAETVEEKNAGLQSIAEPWADTTTPAGRMVLTVFAGIAEFERSLIATRTEEGRRAAQARGVSFGRPPKLRPDQRTLARNLIEEGKSVSDVARTFNAHVATIYRCLHDEAAL